MSAGIPLSVFLAVAVLSGCNANGSKDQIAPERQGTGKSPLNSSVQMKPKKNLSGKTAAPVIGIKPVKKST